MWHPDKNPDAFKEEFIELQQAWMVFNKDQSGARQSQSSGFEYDSFVWNDPPSEEEEEYNPTLFSEEFFISSPEKTFAVPDELRCFFRSGSNRRDGDVLGFIGWSTRTNEEIIVVFIHFNYERRLVDVKKDLRKTNIALAQLFYCVKFNKFCYERYGDLTIKYCIPEERLPTKPETSKFNLKQLVDFALSHQINGVFHLLYEYTHLGQPCDRAPSEITKDHEDDHEEHCENALVFTHVSDRKRIAKNAIDSVFAHSYMILKKEKPQEYLDRHCNEIANSVLEVDDCTLFGEADFYARYHLKKIKTVTLLIYSIPFLTENENLIKQPPDATSSSDSDPDFPPSPRPQTHGLRPSRGSIPRTLFSPPTSRYSIFPSGELHVRHVQQSDALSSFSCRTKHRLTGLSVSSSNPARIIVTEIAQKGDFTTCSLHKLEVKQANQKKGTTSALKSSNVEFQIV
ncbi:hypothetical protein AVEN_16614-1 [Araneus ventricosus]|uniref:T-ag D1-type domain-containing protein n=1 Tax=Araneus ventricosus TaxID=182803 RepID=A0A4Y2S7W1_ARAVE|nr:hypothetical protein AVEN_16614-1 [Araneus ventricosus]